MALFGGKTKEKDSEKKDVSKETAQATDKTSTPIIKNLGKMKMRDVVIRPYITEKAALASENNVYVFQVDPRATKTDIKRAIRAQYSHTPLKVNIARKPGKLVRRRKGMGKKSGLTKAYVYLKKGQTIEVM